MTGIRRHTITAAGIGLCVFVMLEVNYPRLQVQSQLALFALLGMGIVFLHMPWKKGLSEGSLLRRLDWLLFAASVVCFGYIIVQTEPLFDSLWLGDSALGNRAGLRSRIRGASAGF